MKKILDKANADIKNAKTEAEVKAIRAAQAEIDKILTTEGRKQSSRRSTMWRSARFRNKIQGHHQKGGKRSSD